MVLLPMHGLGCIARSARAFWVELQQLLHLCQATQQLRVVTTCWPGLLAQICHRRLQHTRQCCTALGNEHGSFAAWRKTPRDTQSGSHPRDHGEHAIPSQRPNAAGRAVVQKHHHGRRVTCQHAAIDHIAALQITQERTQRAPQGQTKRQHPQRLLRHQHQSNGKHHPYDRARKTIDSARQQVLTHGLTGGPGRHCSPVRVLQPDRISNPQRNECGQGCAQCKCQYRHMKPHGSTCALPPALHRPFRCTHTLALSWV